MIANGEHRCDECYWQTGWWHRRETGHGYLHVVFSVNNEQSPAQYETHWHKFMMNMGWSVVLRMSTAPRCEMWVFYVVMVGSWYAYARCRSREASVSFRDQKGVFLVNFVELGIENLHTKLGTIPDAGIFCRKSKKVGFTVSKVLGTNDTIIM